MLLLSANMLCVKEILVWYVSEKQYIQPFRFPFAKHHSIMDVYLPMGLDLPSRHQKLMNKELIKTLRRPIVVGTKSVA